MKYREMFTFVEDENGHVFIKGIDGSIGTISQEDILILGGHNNSVDGDIKLKDKSKPLLFMVNCENCDVTIKKKDSDKQDDIFEGVE